MTQVPTTQPNPVDEKRKGAGGCHVHLVSPTQNQVVPNQRTRVLPLAAASALRGTTKVINTQQKIKAAF